VRSPPPAPRSRRADAVVASRRVMAPARRGRPGRPRRRRAEPCPPVLSRSSGLGARPRCTDPYLYRARFAKKCLPPPGHPAVPAARPPCPHACADPTCAGILLHTRPAGVFVVRASCPRRLIRPALASALPSELVVSSRALSAGGTRNRNRRLPRWSARAASRRWNTRAERCAPAEGGGGAGGEAAARAALRPFQRWRRVTASPPGRGCRRQARRRRRPGARRAAGR
jgi:hypothetical protein